MRHNHHNNKKKKEKDVMDSSLLLYYTHCCIIIIIYYIIILLYYSFLGVPILIDNRKGGLGCARKHLNRLFLRHPYGCKDADGVGS